MQTSTTTNDIKKGVIKGKNLLTLVYKVWQFFLYNVRKDPIFEAKTLKGTHWI